MPVPVSRYRRSPCSSTRATHSRAPRPQLNVEMLLANARIVIHHAWGSKWYEWPLNLRGILYFSRDHTNENGEMTTDLVYLLGEDPAAARPTRGC